MQKILFLDVDGVMNNVATRERFNSFRGIDPKLAAKVQDIVKNTGCEVVLSSAWRYDKDTREEVKRFVPFMDITPMNMSGIRGAEIAKWLSKNGMPDRYAILDDNSDFYNHQPLFQTDWRFGITDEIVDKVIKHLGLKEYEDMTPEEQEATDIWYET